MGWQECASKELAALLKANTIQKILLDVQKQALSEQQHKLGEQQQTLNRQNNELTAQKQELQSKSKVVAEQEETIKELHKALEELQIELTKFRTSVFINAKFVDNVQLEKQMNDVQKDTARHKAVLTLKEREEQIKTQTAKVRALCKEVLKDRSVLAQNEEQKKQFILEKTAL